MAANPTPDDDDILKALAEDLADGCHTHEVAINIKQNTEAVIRAAIATFDAMKLARGQAESLVDAKNALHQQADDAGAVVLKNCRLRLVKLFGGLYNNEWLTAGWPNGTTAIPTTQAARFSLLGSLKTYFTAVPASESGDMEATAAICGAHGDQQRPHRAAQCRDSTLRCQGEREVRRTHPTQARAWRDRGDRHRAGGR